MAIIADFKNGDFKCYTKSVYQYDKGQQLIIQGIELPEKFEIHFSIHKEGELGTAHAASKNKPINIPNEYLANGGYVYAWIYAKDEDGIDSGATVYSITIPVIKRSSAVFITNTGTKGLDVNDDNHALVMTSFDPDEPAEPEDQG